MHLQKEPDKYRWLEELHVLHMSEETHDWHVYWQGEQNGEVEFAYWLIGHIQELLSKVRWPLHAVQCVRLSHEEHYKGHISHTVPFA